ncbi:MAG: NfeD family protein [Nitrospinae bacterium]|nr:NfeD family protein [Nitrospinota bacterium]
MHISSAWFWAALGIILIIIEVMTFTFILVFLGIGAIVTAITTGLGLTTDIGVQLAVFSATSVISAVLLRKTAKGLYFRDEYKSEQIGAKVTVINEIPARGEGSVLYRGSRWIAFSDAEAAIPAGGTVEIMAVDGIRLKVRPASR